MNGPGKLFLWQIGVQGRLNRLSSILGNGIQSSLWRCVMHGVVPHLEKFECIKPYKKHWDNSVSYFQEESQFAQLAPPFPPLPVNNRGELPSISNTALSGLSCTCEEDGEHVRDAQAGDGQAHWHSHYYSMAARMGYSSIAPLRAYIRQETASIWMGRWVESVLGESSLQNLN